MACGASGGIRSTTANDMLKLLSAYIDPSKAANALQAPLVQTLKTKGPECVCKHRTGLGYQQKWFSSKDWPLLAAIDLL